MTSPINVGNKVLVVSGDDVSSNDTVEFIAAIEQRVGDSGKLQFANLSDIKKGECMLCLVFKMLKNMYTSFAKLYV